MRQELRNIRKEVLPNGLRVITEAIPHVRSVSLGIWITTGSRREPAELNGISHFIEHMVFNGTTHRSAEEIARSVDSIGGQLDAFTAKEMICFNTKVLDEHLPLAFDVLSDLVLTPLLKEDDIQRERSVVLEEIKSDEDSPDYLVHEIFTQNFWRDHPLGKPILGTKETVRRFTRPPLVEYFRRWYAPNNMIIAAAGHLEHERVVELVAGRFRDAKPVEDSRADSPPTVHSRITTRNKKELEQVHICLGVPSYPMTHEKRYAAALLNTILGGGMSSRLFQNIREKQGLVYAVYSDLNPYRDTGCLSIYAGTAAETALRVVRSVMDEFHNLKSSPVPAEELNRAKNHLKGSLMLNLESTSSRMSNLARQEIYFGRFFSLDEIIERIEAVSPEEVMEIARDCFRAETIAVTVLGNLDGFKLTRDQLAC